MDAKLKVKLDVKLGINTKMQTIDIQSVLNQK